MFQQAHYHQTPAAGHMYLEPVQVSGRYGPPMMAASDQAMSPYPSYSSSRASHGMPSRSPAATRYSPGASLMSEGTVGEYPAEVPKSPSLASSKTASPPPQTSAARKPRRRGARSQYSAEEKEMRRKISHSAIEKRRRERTNNVLHDLQHMVPWLSKSSKVQKLEILEAAAQYISQLRGDPASPSSDDTAEDSSARSPMKLNFLLS
ncbi:hypothetical protein IWW50_001932 [Coemansia erecta]|nr:hypothetical protein GGF43_003055 [Coemansia sp. RSA 2618]KAJ2827354.1 hypothetical protein IWW50_001932 [Coemansia erecta]